MHAFDPQDFEEEADAGQEDLAGLGMTVRDGDEDVEDETLVEKAGAVEGDEEEPDMPPYVPEDEEE
ncbi:hypothetical protein HY479_01595 [Candidatus Uhrbacteria bacterium]|nr:hypothetical protein [Candidatus Uhrbacteria bacterium]